MNLTIPKAVLSNLVKPSPYTTLLKNDVGSFSSNIDDNAEKTQKKAEIILQEILTITKLIHLFTFNFGGRLVYRQCCMM